MLQKHCVYRLEKQTILLTSVPQMLKKWRIVVNRISKVRWTTCNWIKKILDEATRIVNVFLISWFFCLFLLCSKSLLVKYDFILRYEAWVNAIRASSFLENFPQISAKSLSSEICSGSSHEIGRSLRIVFQRNWPLKFPRNSREIGRFFPRICPWKSREIWLFFPRPTRSPGKENASFLQTSNINELNWSSLPYNKYLSNRAKSDFMVESWPLMCRPHCIRSILTTLVKILPYRATARLTLELIISYRRFKVTMKWNFSPLFYSRKLKSMLHWFIIFFRI